MPKAVGAHVIELMYYGIKNRKDGENIAIRRRNRNGTNIYELMRPL
jgi:hypothetical protein